MFFEEGALINDSEEVLDIFLEFVVAFWVLMGKRAVENIIDSRISEARGNPSPIALFA